MRIPHGFRSDAWRTPRTRATRTREQHNRLAVSLLAFSLFTATKLYAGDCDKCNKRKEVA